MTRRRAKRSRCASFRPSPELDGQGAEQNDGDKAADEWFHNTPFFVRRSGKVTAGYSPKNARALAELRSASSASDTPKTTAAASAV